MIIMKLCWVLFFTFSVSSFAGQLDSCKWEKGTDFDKKFFCKKADENFDEHSSCFDSLKIYTDSLGRPKQYMYEAPSGLPSQEKAEEVCKDVKESKKNSCLRTVTCKTTLNSDTGDKTEECKKAELSEENEKKLSLPLVKITSFYYENGEVHWERSKIIEKLCQSKGEANESCYKNSDLVLDGSGRVLGLNLMKGTGTKFPEVSFAREYCKKERKEDTPEYNYCVRVLECDKSKGKEGDCKIRDTKDFDESDLKALMEPANDLCLDKTDPDQSPVVKAEVDKGTILEEKSAPIETKTVLPSMAEKAIIFPTAVVDNCKNLRGAERVRCYADALGQRPDELIKACNISEERYKSGLTDPTLTPEGTPATRAR